MLSTYDERGFAPWCAFEHKATAISQMSFSLVDTFNVDVDDAHLENARAYV